MLAMINRVAAYSVASIIGMMASMILVVGTSVAGLFLLIIAPALTILIHELGHAFAA